MISTDGNARPVRLVGGSGPYEGRVEVLYMTDDWGTVCNEDWDSLDAQVVCSQLGYTGVLDPSTDTAAEFDTSDSPPIAMFNVGCAGTESLLGDCSHNGELQAGSCVQDEIAGVKCSYGEHRYK